MSTTDVEHVQADTPAQQEAGGAGVAQSEANRMWKVATTIANTKLVSKPLQGNPEAVMGVGLHLAALGIPFSLVGLKQVHVWEDRGTIQMQLHYQAHIALMARAGHDAWLHELTDDHATFKVIRCDTGREQSFTYTMAMAKKAGLLGKDNWQKHPHYMLPARAAVMAARFACPDALIGLDSAGTTTIRPTSPDQVPALTTPTVAQVEGGTHAALPAGKAQSEGPAPSAAPPPNRHSEPASRASHPTVGRRPPLPPEAEGDGPDDSFLTFGERRRLAYQAMDAAGITSDEGRRCHVKEATKGRRSDVASLSEADLFDIVAAAEALDA